MQANVDGTQETAKKFKKELLKYLSGEENRERLLIEEVRPLSLKPPYSCTNCGTNSYPIDGICKYCGTRFKKI